MIRYDLTCDSGHDFDAWFPGSDAFDDQVSRGLVTCPHCGDARVRKAIMAPNVAKGGPRRPDAPVTLGAGLPAEARRALRELRARVLSGSEHVGDRFAEQALAMHRGEIPHRQVHGEADPGEVRELVREGVPFAPIPPEPGGH